jgi:hypothetical protein
MALNVKTEKLIELCHAINIALEKSFADISQDEPQLIANLVWHLPNGVNNIAINNNETVKTGGIFVHSSPLVLSTKFPNNSKSVEIGDLLLLRTEMHHAKVTKKHALLLQAKKTLTTPTTPKNDNQYYLYSRWPKFKYTRPKPLTGQIRIINGKDLSNASKYLFINTIKNINCFCPSIWTIPLFCEHNICYFLAQPLPHQLSHHSCLVNELLLFILGLAGKEYKDPNSDRDIGWNRVIKDLISVTASRSSKHIKKATEEEQSSRGNIPQVYFTTGTTKTGAALDKAIGTPGEPYRNNDGPPIIEIDPGPPEESRGIPIIEFIVSRSE